MTTYEIIEIIAKFWVQTDIDREFTLFCRDGIYQVDAPNGSTVFSSESRVACATFAMYAAERCQPEDYNDRFIEMSPEYRALFDCD